MDLKKLLTEFEPATKNEWLAEAEIALKGKPLSSLTGKTHEGIDIRPIYFMDDAELHNITNDAPGIYPFRRGTSDAVYRDEPWLICQAVNHYDPQQFNKIAKSELTRGATAIAMRALNPGIAYDNLYKGTYISSVSSIAEALSGLDFNNFTLFFTFDSTSIYAFKYLIEYIENLSVDKDKIKIFASYDYFSELLESGRTLSTFDEYIHQIMEFAVIIKPYPFIKLLGLNPYTYKDMGANTIHETAFAVCSALDIINYLKDIKFDINEIIDQFHFNMSVSNDFFMEIAKFRATRAIWSVLIKSITGDENLSKVHIRAISALTNKSKLDMQTNILRETAETLSSVIGGCDAITMIPFDNPHLSNNEFPMRIARNTQLVIANECNQMDTIDPAGGAWYIESLTNELINKSWELILSIEDEGGFLKSIDNGTIHKLINEVRQKRISALSTRKEILIGVNKYPNMKDAFENNAYDNYINEANEYRTKLSVLSSFTEEDYKSKTTKIPQLNLSDTFIELRKRAASIESATGKPPRAFLAGFGTLKQYKARIDFSREFLSVGGFECVSASGLTSIDDAVSEYCESGINMVVLCSTDDTYPEIVPAFTKALKLAKPGAIVVLAGYPVDLAEEFKQAGVNEFIHVKADICRILSGLLNSIESRG